MFELEIIGKKKNLSTEKLDRDFHQQGTVLSKDPNLGYVMAEVSEVMPLQPLKGIPDNLPLLKTFYDACRELKKFATPSVKFTFHRCNYLMLNAAEQSLRAIHLKDKAEMKQRVFDYLSKASVPNVGIMPISLVFRLYGEIEK